MRRSAIVFTVMAVVFCSLNGRASLSVDSFTDGDFFLSLGVRTAIGTNIDGPIGTFRLVSISSREATEGSSISAALSTSSGTLSLDIDGQSMFAERPLYLDMDYASGGPYSIAGFDAFEFDFSGMAGTGSLIVALGGTSGIFGPETLRVPLTGPGLVEVPFDQLNLGILGFIDSFYAMQIRFEAETTQFSFTLDEIRLVPEPSSLACLLVGGLCLFWIRRAVRPRQPVIADEFAARG
jgi:hypothetical protein